MRFLLTGDIRKNGIRGILWLFVVFIIIYWISNIILFLINFRESLNSLEFSFAAMTEEIHVNIFMNSLLFLCLLPFVIYSGIRIYLKFLIIIASFSSIIFDVLAGLIVSVYGASLLTLKIASFSLKNIVLLINIIIFIKYIYRCEKENNNRLKGLFNLLIILFAISNILFIFSNVLAHHKIGFTADRMVEYYLGSKEKFIRPKTFHGILQIFNTHIIASSLYLFALSHFLLLVNHKLSIFLSALMFLSGLLNFISPFFIKYLSAWFLYMKFISFWIMQLSMMISSGILLAKPVDWRYWNEG